jgi:hypothetical protein
MVCCLMLGVLAGLLRSLWGIMTLQHRRPASLFAPVAYRPGADGALSRETSAGEACVPPVVASAMVGAGRTQAAPPSLLPACLVALALYLAFIPSLQAAGGLLYASSAAAWLLRSAVLGVVAIALAAGMWMRLSSPDRIVGAGLFRHRSRLVATGVVLHASGLLWVAMALADLHVFSVIQPVGMTIGVCADTPWLQFLAHDYQTHFQLAGPGIAALAAGWVMYRLGSPPPALPDALDTLSMPPPQTESPEHAARG